MKRFTTKVNIIFFAVFLSISFAQCNLKHESKGIRALNPKEAYHKIQKGNIRVLDVRTPTEYKTGHLPNARHFNYHSDTFRQALKNLPKDEDYLFYCESGRRSYKAAKRLLSKGHEPVWHLESGIEAWEEAQLPIEKPTVKQ